jgi:hypothetical protein
LYAWHAVRQTEASFVGTITRYSREGGINLADGELLLEAEGLLMEPLPSPPERVHAA